MAKVTLAIQYLYPDWCATFEKDAPELPHGVTWHEGIVFDGAEGELEPFTCSYVQVDSAGDTSVVFQECDSVYNYKKEGAEETTSTLLSRGWKLTWEIRRFEHPQFQ